MQLKHLLFILLAIVFPFNWCFSQSVQWGHKIGGSGTDNSWATKVAANGNVYIAGFFSGTTDLDPSAGVYNITSNGSQDIFLACYTAGGVFQWGFKVGGTSNDGVFELDVDAQSNVFIVGYFLGQNIDFDPSVGNALLSDNGSSGSAPWGGDGFVAKYSATGAYQWAYNLGGSTIYDFTESVAVDGDGNVYIGGAFIDPIDIDPSAGVTTLNNATGKSYLIKYTGSGQLVWGRNFLTPGGSGVNSTVRSIAIRNGSLAICGFFQNTADLDLSSNIVLATAQGYDGFVAEFDTAGNYIFSDHLQGGGTYEFAREVTFDPSGNIYLVGYTAPGTTSLLFGGSIAVNAPGGGGNADMYMAKYSGSGNVQWAKMIGGSQNETAEAITYAAGHIFCTGAFGGTVDFDPNGGVTNLTSAGNMDAFVAKYDINGNYICGFSVGAAGSDGGWDIAPDAQNNIYLGGHFSNTVDFDPSLATYNLGGTSGEDAFLVKYVYATIANSFSVTTDTICAGQQAYITLTDTAGAGPFTLTISDGSTNYTYNNIQSGVPFALTPSPVITTLYTWNISTSQSVCANSSSSGSFTVLVNPQPAANAGSDISVCNNIFVQLNGSGGGTYSWTPSSVLNNAAIANPTLTVTDTTLTFILIVSNGFGCTDTDQVNVSVHASPVANAGPDTSFCGGSAIQLQGTGGASYFWFPGTGLNNVNVSNPVFSGTGTSLLSMVVINQYNCRDTDQVIVAVVPQPVADAGGNISECSSTFIQLNGAGGGTYAWSPGSVLSNSTIANPTLTVTDTTLVFTLIVTNNAGCSDTDQVIVSVHQGIANANAGPDTAVCVGTSLQLQGSGGTTYNWFPATGLSNPNIPGPIYTGSTAAVITLVVTDQYNCSDTDQVLVNMLPEPVAVAGADTQVCANVPVQLQGTGGNSYNWYPVTGMTGGNTATPTVMITGTVTYYLIATNTTGCSDTDAVQLSIPAPPVFGIAPQQDICPDDSVQLYASGGKTYLWYPDVNISSTNTDTVTVWPAANTTYYVMITEPVCGYTDTQSVLVNHHSLPPVKITKASPIGCGQSMGLLEATGAVQYLWSPSATLTSDNIANPASFTNVATWYTVKGTDQFGCVAYDSVLMKILSDDLSGLYIPTAFTPNADGKNDCYRMKLPPQVDEFELHIYNRYGNNVFNADDVMDCWDGTYKGEPSDVGVYYYYYKLKSNACGKEKEGKGDITLLR